MVAHHLKTLQVVTGAVVGVRVLGLAVLVEGDLSIPMGSIYPHEALTFGLQQILLCIIEPSINKVTVQAISISHLFDH